MAFDMIERAPAKKPGGWSATRFIAWTVLLCALVFWATLIIPG
jgi:hypothetical protein